jgi:hypothetical protein
MKALITNSLADAVPPVPMKAILVGAIDSGCGAKNRVVLFDAFSVRNVRAHQVAHQLCRRDQPAAIVAQVDDDVGDALRPEARERLAQRRVGGRDEGAQVDVADVPPAIGDDLRAVAR